MSDPNEEIFLATSRAALKRLVQTAWHDSAAATAERVVDAIARRNAALVAATAERALYEGTWTQFFTEDGASVERECTLVVSPGRGDVQRNEIVAMTVTRDLKDRDASDQERAETMDSLEVNDVFADPETWDLNLIDDLPAWAADQVSERAEAVR